MSIYGCQFSLYYICICVGPLCTLPSMSGYYWSALRGGGRGGEWRGLDLYITGLHFYKEINLLSLVGSRPPQYIAFTCFLISPYYQLYKYLWVPNNHNILIIVCKIHVIKCRVSVSTQSTCSTYYFKGLNRIVFFILILLHTYHVQLKSIPYRMLCLCFILFYFILFSAGCFLCMLSISVGHYSVFFINYAYVRSTVCSRC